jgi:hypothetical protein
MIVAAGFARGTLIATEEYMPFEIAHATLARFKPR